MIPHNRPWITAEDRAAVDRCLASGWIAQGPRVAELEGHFVAMYGGGAACALSSGGAACALSSGSAALLLALKALDIGAGRRVAVPTYACSALLNAVFWAGAQPVVADVLPDSWALDPQAIAAADAAIVVHAYGMVAPMAEYRARLPGPLIEDCCQALGGRQGGALLGQAGDAAVFSFYATKIAAAGHGGLVWSRDAALIERVRDIRQFDGRADYAPRFNFQLTDIQAALASSQLARLEEIRARRIAVARRYLACVPAGCRANFAALPEDAMPYRFVLVADTTELRERLRQHMAERAIGCIVPVERYELLHRYLGLPAADYPVAERLADTTLSLPLYPALEASEVDAVCEALTAFRP